MKFYATYNPERFHNTYQVLAFNSKKARDEFVEKTNYTKAIRRKELRQYLDDPKPFSGERFLIDTSIKDWFKIEGKQIPGLIGQVVVKHPDNCWGCIPVNH